MKISWLCSRFPCRISLCRNVEHTISQLVDKHVDLSVFDARYNNDETGATAIHPKILLKVILLAYAKGMISSRQIERAARRISFSSPSRMGMLPITARSLNSSLRCKARSRVSSATSCWCARRWVLLGGTHFSLDGVKLSANVSKEWSGTFDELKHKRDKLQEKLNRSWPNMRKQTSSPMWK